MEVVEISQYSLNKKSTHYYRGTNALIAKRKAIGKVIVLRTHIKTKPLRKDCLKDHCTYCKNRQTNKQKSIGKLFPSKNFRKSLKFLQVEEING